MARTANPDKPKIDALRAEGKLHVKAINDGNKALKKLASVNAKLAKFDVAEIPVPEMSAPAAPAKAKTPAKAATKAVAAKKATKTEAPAKAALAKGTKGKTAKSVTTAPKKGRGRPKASDSDLDFD